MNQTESCWQDLTFYIYWYDKTVHVAILELWRSHDDVASSVSVQKASNLYSIQCPCRDVIPTWSEHEIPLCLQFFSTPQCWLNDIKECWLYFDNWSLLPASPHSRYQICCGGQFCSHFNDQNFVVSKPFKAVNRHHLQFIIIVEGVANKLWQYDPHFLNESHLDYNLDAWYQFLGVGKLIFHFWSVRVVTSYVANNEYCLVDSIMRALYCNDWGLQNYVPVT